MERNKEEKEEVVVTLLQTIQLEVTIPVHTLSPEQTLDAVLLPQEQAEKEVIDLLERNFEKLGGSFGSKWKLNNLESVIGQFKAYTTVFPRD